MGEHCYSKTEKSNFKKSLIYTYIFSSAVSLTKTKSKKIELSNNISQRSHIKKRSNTSIRGSDGLV